MKNEFGPLESGGLRLCGEGGALALKLQMAVVQETRRIAVGTAILCAVMLLVFLLIGRMTWQVALGALVGYAAAVGNFFVMALDVQRLMDGIDPNEDGAVKRAKATMRLSYNRRMIVMVLLLGAAIYFLQASWITTLLPLTFPRIVIKTWQFIQNRKSKGSEA